MRFGYNTNGFAHHPLDEAFEELASIGYTLVAVTLERELLEPPDGRGVAAAVKELHRLRRRSGLELTIETGARFILDPDRKHRPTLVSESNAERARRREFLLAAIEVGAAVEARCVSLWSGTPDERADPGAVRRRLEDELRTLLGHAEAGNVRLGFEPEPGMFIETMEEFTHLHEAIDHPLFGLTLDVGHVHCLGDGDPAVHIRRWHKKLFNVHLEDMKRDRHEHLMFGEGEMRFAPMFEALHAVGYDGPLTVELSRHSHDAVETARRAFRFLQRWTT